VNLSELRARVRFWLNEQGTTDGFYSDPDLDTLINDGNQRLNRAIANIQPEFFTVSSTFQTIADTKAYALPTDFQKMVRLEKYLPADPSDIVKLVEANFPRIEGGGGWPVTRSGVPYSYFIRSNQMEFIPIPDGVYDIRIYYSNAKPKLLLGADLPSPPEDFHDMIALHAVVFALLKNSEPSLEFQRLYDRRQNELMESIQDRDGTDPEFVEGFLEEEF